MAKKNAPKSRRQAPSLNRCPEEAHDHRSRPRPDNADAAGHVARPELLDLWFALVAVKDSGGDLDRLARIKEREGIFYDRDSAERKRWHLRDLMRRLDGASVTPAQVVEAAGALGKNEKYRAQKKVMESSDLASGWSEPMRNTPRSRRYPLALRGSWDRFPVSPQPYYETIRHTTSQRASTPWTCRSGSLAPWTSMRRRRRSCSQRARRAGPGSPAGLDGRDPRTHGAGGRLLRQHRHELR